jgi:hypothetical protein
MKICIYLREIKRKVYSIINFFFKIIYGYTKMFQFRHTYYIIIHIDYLLIFFMRGELLWITLLILHDGSLQ